MNRLTYSWQAKLLGTALFLLLAQVLTGVASADVASAGNNKPSTPDSSELKGVQTKHLIKEGELYLDQLQLTVDRQKASLDQAKMEGEIRVSIFGRQLWYHPLILFSVISIVLAGVYLSYLQVKRDLTTGSSQESSLELTRDGLKVRSPVIGLFILIVSLGFFYLYLKEVYHITEATGSVRAPETQSLRTGQASVATPTPSTEGGSRAK